MIMGLQKDEARAAPVRPDKIVELLHDMYRNGGGSPLGG